MQSIKEKYNSDLRVAQLAYGEARERFEECRKVADERLEEELEQYRMDHRNETVWELWKDIIREGYAGGSFLEGVTMNREAAERWMTPRSYGKSRHRIEEKKFKNVDIAAMKRFLLDIIND